MGAFAVLLNVRVLGAPFLEFDDQYFILTDQAVRSLNLDSLRRIFTEPYFANFHPLTRLSYALDYALFGFNATAFHATSLLLYGIACALAFVFLNRLIGKPLAAAAGALIFAAHPTHVEVTAWLSARKDLLCLVFALCACLLFFSLRECGRLTPGRYAALLACAACAGLSKSLAVVLPVLFLCFDLAWFRRLRGKEAASLLPLFLIMIGVGVANFHAQASAGAVKSAAPPLAELGGIALHYFSKTVLPIGLSGRYVLEVGSASPAASAAGFALLLASAGAALALYFKGRRLAPLAFAWFLIPLLPVSNLIPLSTPMADRYLFWPTLGWSLLLAGALALPQPRWSPKAAYVLCGALLIFLSAETWKRVEVWRSDESLWKDALEQNPRNYFALAALGNQALEAGRTSEAGTLLGRAMDSARGRDSGVLLSYGKFLSLSGRKEEALDCFRKAYALGGEAGWLSHRAAYNIGLMLAGLGRTEEAEDWYRKALELARKTQESRVQILINLANLYYDAKDYAKAEAAYREACAEGPKDPRPCFYLGMALEGLGRYADAEKAYLQALALREPPRGAAFDYGDVHLMLGKLYQERLGDPARALREYEEALEVSPNHPQREALQGAIRYLEEKEAPGGGG